MNILSVVTPPSIYNDCFTWKKFCEESFTGEKIFTLGEFTDVDMKNCVRNNVRKHRGIKGGDKYVTLDILLKFDSLYKIRIISAEPKDNLGILGKGLINSSGLREKARPNKYKKAKYYL